MYSLPGRCLQRVPNVARTGKGERSDVTLIQEEGHMQQMSKKKKSARTNNRTAGTDREKSEQRWKGVPSSMRRKTGATLLSRKQKEGSRPPRRSGVILPPNFKRTNWWGGKGRKGGELAGVGERGVRPRGKNISTSVKSSYSLEERTQLREKKEHGT